jgi:hypothetical protein
VLYGAMGGSSESVLIGDKDCANQKEVPGSSDVASSKGTDPHPRASPSLICIALPCSVHHH